MKPDRNKDRNFMDEPGEWPRWPLLPLKLRHGSGDEQDYLGFMFADRRPIVYLGTIFLEELWKVEPKPKTWADAFKNLRRTEYDDLESLLDVWTVD